MPGVPSARRRPPNSRSRPSRSSHSRSTAQDGAGNDGPPPKKKMKYIPGGPGGGGRYVDTDGTEIPVGGTGPGGYAYAGPRGPVGRQNAANGVQPQIYERPRRESRRERPAPRLPRYSSAAAAAAAVVQGDGFKPREERSWEEFHQNLDIELRFPVFSADEVDGIIRPEASTSPLPQSPNGAGTVRVDSTDATTACSIQLGEYKEFQISGDSMATPIKVGDSAEHVELPPAENSALRRRPGRPPRRHDSMLKGIGTPETPKIIPLPGPNPREKLTLPKPSFRRVDPFTSYEVKAAAQNFVDRTMASVGYQESDIYIRPEKKLIRVTEGSLEDDLDVATIAREKESNLTISMGALSVGRVEYDMDEQDQKWLEEYNARRKEEQVEPVKPAIFEIIMTKIEKEWHSLEKRIPKPNPKPPQTHRPRSSSAAAVNGETHGIGEEQDSKCAICDDGDCENTNAIVFCDGCDLAVHQECYGVPYIPEGQWLCRKCQLIGRGTPTCIFCPNIEGAFKQTNSSKWSHLLCAIWIPEVSLGNPTFMEPVMDVEKVPKQRWKLTCYICHQRMGACIQCGNKNCFVAFHVTCARRARLFLQMKSSNGGPASFDSNLLKAYCDKHVPNDWRKDNEVDNAIEEAKTYYRRTMRHRVWADSQQSAMNITTIQDQPPPEPIEDENKVKLSLTFGNKKRNRNLTPKTIWKTSAGAPVVPAVVYDLIEESCNRLTVRKRKPFAEDMCKYWTLKREARRGAALLKRLQLQMETFSSMEMTRRNFAGMGAAGRVRLDRRIEFADQLLQDVEKLKQLCDEIRTREREKLRDAEMLRDIIDTVYFPIPPLLWPIIDKAQALDGKKTFYDGLALIRERMEQRFYTSVSTFSADLTAVFSAGIGINHIASPSEAQSHITGDSLKKGLTSEQKEKKKLAKRIIKAVQPALEDAMRKESELCRKPFEKELQDMDLNLLLEASISSRRDSMAVSAGGYVSDEEADINKPAAANGLSAGSNELTLGSPIKSVAGGETEMEGVEYENVTNGTAHGHETMNKGANDAQQTPKKGNAVHQPTPEDSNATPSAADLNHINESKPSQTSALQAHVPPTPPLSSGGDHQTPLSNGGIPWYLEPFDPVGTTIHEERWTGREVTRAMSEELSDMEEDELSGLVEGDLGETNGTLEDMDVMQVGVGVGGTQAIVKVNSTLKKSGKQKKRWKGFK